MRPEGLARDRREPVLRPITDPASRRERLRLGGIQVGVLFGVAAVVLVVAQLLAVLPGFVYPVVFTAVTVLLLVAAVVSGHRGALGAAHLWAGWAGVLALLMVLAWSSLLGWGGALTSTLLVAVVVNVAIAALVRSSVHLAVTMLLSLPWGVLAHLYGIPPVAILVLALVGLYWLSAVRYSSAVVVATTLLLPLGLALFVHPRTHDGLAVDGADVASVAGLTLACSLLGGMRTVARPDPRLWPTMRATVLTALVVQVVAGALPPVAGLLAPVDPWPGLLTGLALGLAAAAVALRRGTRPGWWRCAFHATVLWGSVLAAVLLPPPWPTLLVVLAYSGAALRVVRRTGADTGRGLAALLGVAALVAGGLLVARPSMTAAAAVCALACVVLVVAAMRRGPVPPVGRTDGRPAIR